MQNQVDYQTIYEAMKNVQDFNFMNYSYNSWFEALKVELFKAFDEVTTIDMRSYDQMELLMDESYVGVVTEKDGRLYPYMCLAIKVKYGYYDANSVSVTWKLNPPIRKTLFGFKGINWILQEG